MIVQSLTQPMRTMGELNKQREDQSFTDIVVLVEGVKFHAHRAILAANSSVFRSVLQETTTEGTPNINLDGVESTNFLTIINFIYTSNLTINQTNVDQISATSEFLKISSIVELCAKFKQQLNNDESSKCDEPDISDNEEENIEVEEDCSSRLQSTEDTKDSELQVEKRRGRKSMERVECPICHKVTTEVRMEAHLRYHNGGNPVTCGWCGRSFANIYNLKIHERIHTGERPHKCQVCSKTFSDPSSLSKHKLWHAGVKKKSCPVCRRMFATATQVRDHIRTHTKEKPFACEQCGKSYGYKCDLTRHMREHNGNLFGPCPDCGRLFNHNGNYKAHLKTHLKKQNPLQVFFVEENEVIVTSQDKQVSPPSGEIGKNLDTSMNNGSCVMSQEEEVMSATTSLEQNMLSHDDIVKNENSLVIVDQTMESNFET
ncbi:zinc finger protein [Ciona intestinalis]